MKKSAGIFLFFVCAFLLAACQMSYTPSTSTQACKLNLQVYVRQGINAGYTIAGQVDFGTSTWAGPVGDLVEEGGASHQVSFSNDGQAVHFIIDTDKGRIYGTGIMDSSLADCSGSGGGTLSGPVPGDLGDWRGTWESRTVPVTPQPETPGAKVFPSTTCITLVGFVTLIALVVVFSRLFAPLTKTRSPKGSSPSSALHRTATDGRPLPGSGDAPLAEYMATYTAEDRFFDLSFQIEEATRYLGECGITVAKTPDGLASQATALDIWLFDTHDIQTVSKVLISDFGYRLASWRSELEKKGEVIPIRPDGVVVLETRELKAMAKVLQVEYADTPLNPNSVFQRVVIKIGVWKNTGGSNG
jgi:hypothetical protein